MTELDERTILHRVARARHRRFVKHCWRKPQEPFIVGRHTREICREIDEAMDRFRRGESSYLIIKVPFRHGKSDLASRYLPAHFLGEFPSSEIMIVSYSAKLSQGFSRYAQQIVTSESFAELYPGYEINPRVTAPNRWEICEPGVGSVVASGLRSGAVGRGYHLGLVDDYHGSRKEAESKAYRDTAWFAFTNDIMTRRAPVSITAVVASPWNTDDLIARCEQAMETDPDFPKFKVVKFSAFDESYPGGTLFPERYSAHWYETQRAALGSYGTASLLQCEPVTRGGNMLKVDMVVEHASVDEAPNGLKWMRVWDMAHTKAERATDDPDWTSGTKMAVKHLGSERYEVWIADVARFRESAGSRDEIIVRVAMDDEAPVTQYIESSIDSLDAVDTIRRRLHGVRTVRQLSVKGDKVARASAIEATFEAGNVHVVRGPWLDSWKEEVASFPSGAHDDQVDNLSAGFNEAARRRPALVETYR